MRGKIGEHGAISLKRQVGTWAGWAALVWPLGCGDTGHTVGDGLASGGTGAAPTAPSGPSSTTNTGSGGTGTSAATTTTSASTESTTETTATTATTAGAGGTASGGGASVSGSGGATSASSGGSSGAGGDPGSGGGTGIPCNAGETWCPGCSPGEGICVVGGGCPGFQCGDCANEETLESCDSRPECHPVFFDPNDCFCSTPGCCAMFSHCSEGASADCVGPQTSCAVPTPLCEDPFVVSYVRGCANGCARLEDCAE